MRNYVLMISLLLASCTSREPAETVARKSISGVQTEVVRHAAIEDSFEVSGTVRSRASTTVAARVMGHITKLSVGEGDTVRAGQLLAEIDSRDAAVQATKAEAGEAEARSALDEVDHAIRAAEFALGAAKANRELAATTLERYRTLRDRRSVSQQEYDEVRNRDTAASAEAGRAQESLDSLKARRAQILARIDQARADRSAATLHEGYAQVLAPASGIVTVKHVETGMLASPGSPLVTIEDSAYRLEVAVDERRMTGIRPGTRARVTLDAFKDQAFDAQVSRILPASDPATRTFTLRLDLAARPGLRSGLYGRASFPAGQTQALTIPESAILRQGQLTGTWVLEDRSVRYRLIRLGKSIEGRVEVLSGLNDGDVLVLGPREQLADGLEVRP